MKVVFKARQTPKGTNGPDSASEAASVRLARAGGDFTGHGDGKQGPTPYYADDLCTLYCGDAMHILPTLEAGSVDAVVTDPPYGINHSSSHGASWQNTTIAGDSDTSARDAAISLYPTLPTACFGTWKTPPIAGVKAAIVWNKGPAFGMGDLAFPWKPSWELIYIRGDGWAGFRDEGVLSGPIVVTWESQGRKHPHQKPVWIIERFISKLPNVRTVLDPFTGSGTTAVACIRTGRKFIGIEIDPGYCAIAVDRIKAARSSLFDPPQIRHEQMLIGGGK